MNKYKEIKFKKEWLLMSVLIEFLFFCWFPVWTNLKFSKPLCEKINCLIFLIIHIFSSERKIFLILICHLSCSWELFTFLKTTIAILPSWNSNAHSFTIPAHFIHILYQWICLPWYLTLMENWCNLWSNIFVIINHPIISSKF